MDSEIGSKSKVCLLHGHYIYQQDAAYAATVPCQSCEFSLFLENRLSVCNRIPSISSLPARAIPIFL
jgi:hypothetical protein